MADDDDLLQEMNEADRLRLAKAVRELKPFYDTVQIFVTRHDEITGTVSADCGAGNVLARYGQTSTWVDGFLDEE